MTYGGVNVNVVNYDHSLVSGVADSFSANGTTYGFLFTNTDVESLISCVSNGDALAIRSIGLGHAIYVGFDYNNNSYENEKKVLANAVALSYAPWVSCSPLSGTVAAGQSSNIDVELNATGLLTGTHSKSIIIENNDPLNALASIGLDFSVSGEPIVGLSTEDINFGEVQAQGTGLDSLIISNTGCDTLFLSSIISSDAVFEVSFTDTLVLPNDSITLELLFYPTSNELSRAVIDLETNIGNMQVALQGAGIASPEMVVSGDIVASVSDCSGSDVQQITIDNNGDAELIYNITNSSLIDVEECLVELNERFEEITNIIPNRFDFSDGVSGNYISDGGNDMYDTGNRLSTDFQSYLSYSDDIVLSDGAFGDNGSYFTRKYSGLFVLASEVDGISQFTISGGNGADGGGSVDASVIRLTSNFRNYLGFVKRVYNASDPSINHLVIVPDNGVASHSYSTDSDNDEHIISGLEGVEELHYLLYAGASGYYIDDEQATLIMQQYINIIENHGIDFSSLTGIVAANESTTIDVFYDATDLESGIYDNEIIVSSNDPLNSVDTIASLFSVSGSPTLSVSENILEFGSEFVDAIKQQNLLVKNTGCDTLIITAITSSETLAFVSDFVSNDTLAPDETITYVVDFTPSSEADYSGNTLTIVSNTGVDEIITLNGIGTISSIMEIALAGDLDFDAQLINTTAYASLTISNSGNSDLTVSNITTPHVDIVLN